MNAQAHDQTFSETIDVDLNSFDEAGNVVDSTSMPLSRSQISDIIDHAAQLMLVLRGESGGDDQIINQVIAELDEALLAADVIEPGELMLLIPRSGLSG